MITTIDLFTTPLFRTVYDKNKEILNTLVPIFKELEAKDTSPWEYGVNGYTSFGKGNLLKDLPECVDLYYWIRNIVFNIHQETKLAGDVEISDSWYSINRKYDTHEEHHHIPAVWSGVYYLQANNADANITFSNTSLDTNWPYNKINEFNIYNTKEKTFPVESGTLFVFPAYLKHKVETQLSDNERISIAFNVTYKENSK